MSGEGVLGVKLCGEHHLLQSGNDEGVARYVVGVGLGDVLRDGCHIGIGRQGCALLAVGHGIDQSRLATEVLHNDGDEELKVVLLDVVGVALIGYLKTQIRAIERQRRDGRKPRCKLLVRGVLAKSVKAGLPYFIVCLRVRHYFC